MCNVAASRDSEIIMTFMWFYSELPHSWIIVSFRWFMASSSSPGYHLYQYQEFHYSRVDNSWGLFVLAYSIYSIFCHSLNNFADFFWWYDCYSTFYSWSSWHSALQSYLGIIACRLTFSLTVDAHIAPDLLSEVHELSLIHIWRCRRRG